MFIFDFLNFLSQNCSMFNNSCTINLNTIKLPRCTLPTVQEHDDGGTVIWDISMTNKPNKQLTFLNIYIDCVKVRNDISNEKINNSSINFSSTYLSK
jgi:hypothetical protein